MSQMTDDMARNIVANWERTKQHYGITAWEECQLARKWLSAADALDAQAERIKALEKIERYAMILTIAATDATSHDDWGWREIQSALVEALAEQPADFEDKARALLGEK